MRKKVIPILLSLVLLTSCASANTEIPAEPAEITEAPAEIGTEDMTEKKTVAAPLTDYVSEEGFAEADKWGSCDDTNLACVMRKAESGEKVTVAVIGGSITQGTISNGGKDSEVPFKKCYADLFFEWWKDTFPNAEFEFVNAGIGATDSYLGVHRVGEDVLKYKPDLVLVEFSVNDDGSSNCKTNYDNLVRRIAKSESAPAIMLLFMGQTNGSNAQNQHQIVGFKYELPMISYANYISYAMANGDFDAKELSGDVTHPSALGHAITGELLWKYMNNVYENLDSFGEKKPFDYDSVCAEIYLDSKILDSTSLNVTDLGTFEESSVFNIYPYNFTCKDGDGGLTFEVEASRIGIMFYRTTDSKSGQFEVYVDGEMQTSLNGDFTGGWGNYAECRSVYSGDAGLHTVEIRKADNSEGDVFSILGVLVSE